MAKPSNDFQILEKSLVKSFEQTVFHCYCQIQQVHLHFGIGELQHITLVTVNYYLACLSMNKAIK